MVHCAVACLVLIDTLCFLLGVAILCVSIYAVAAYGYFEVFFPVYTVYISVTVGALLMLVGMFGCWSSTQAKRGFRSFAFCYIFLVLACLVANLASLVLVDQELGGLVSRQTSLASSALMSSSDIALNNALLSSYTTCCVGCGGPPGECTNARPSFDNITRPFCLAAGGGNVRICQPVRECNMTTSGDDGCYVNADGVLPPVNIDSGICTAFAKLDVQHYNSTALQEARPKLVGFAGQGGCGGGDPAQYTTNVIEFFDAHMHYLITGLGVLCGLQALNLIGAVLVFCCEKGSGRKYESY